MTAIERYAAPKSLDEALGILQQGEVTILAGGTDLMPQTKAGRVAFKSDVVNPDIAVKDRPTMIAKAKAVGQSIVATPALVSPRPHTSGGHSMRRRSLAPLALTALLVAAPAVAAAQSAAACLVS